MEKQQIIDDFHRLYYFEDKGKLLLNNTKWFGHTIAKIPFDLMMYQEIIFETKPDVIIECGTYCGGSALFFAHLLDLNNNGKVISIDIMPRENLPVHDRITYLRGSTTDVKILDKVKSFISAGDKVMVVLDSDHHVNHVLNELKMYGNLVSVGCYMVCEDTNISSVPIASAVGKGPKEAVDLFLTDNKCFKIDDSREKYLLTFFHNGWLLKVK